MNQSENKKLNWIPAKNIIKNGTLSVILPVHNLDKTIIQNIKTVYATFENQIPFEIIAVDDGSSDRTFERLEELEKTLPLLKIVKLEENTGKGYALKEGFNVSSGNYVLFLDGDLDLPPEQAPGLFQIMEQENCDVVIGSKRHHDSQLHYPWHRKIVSATYYMFVKMMFGLSVHDTQTGIKLFKRQVLDWTCPRMLVKRFAFDLELLVIAKEKGFTIREAPVVVEFKALFGCFRPTTIKQITKDTLAIFYRSRILKYYRSIQHTHLPQYQPLVSIVIAYPEATGYLSECLKGLAAQKYDNYEVILLPDQSEYIEQPTKNLTIAPTGRIRPAEKRNIGIKKARGKIVAFLDDDATPKRNWLTQAVACFGDPSVGAVGGPAISARNDPYMAKLSGRVYANRLISGNFRYRYVPTRVLEIEDFPSCNLFVLKNVLDNINGFRTEYWPGEDTLLCMDIIKKEKKRILYDPRIEVTHHRRKLFFPHLRQISRYAMHRGYFAKKFPATSRKISYLLPSLFLLGLIFGFITSAFLPILRIPYLGCLTLYCIISLLFSMSKSPLKWAITWIGIILTHITYGAFFLYGLASKNISSEMKQFDHASESQS